MFHDSVNSNPLFVFFGWYLLKLLCQSNIMIRSSLTMSVLINQKLKISAKKKDLFLGCEQRMAYSLVVSHTNTSSCCRMPGTILVLVSLCLRWYQHNAEQRTYTSVKTWESVLSWLAFMLQHRATATTMCTYLHVCEVCMLRASNDREEDTDDIEWWLHLIH